MPALGLGLSLSRSSFEADAFVPTVPQNLQAANEDLNIALTWDADDNLGYAVFYNTVPDFGTASLHATVNAGFSNYGFSTPVNTDPTSSPGAGTKYYIWITATDGGVTPTTDPSNAVSGRGYVNLANTATVTLYVPGGATTELQNLLFSAGGVLPDGVVVNDGNGWETIEGDWYDSDTFDLANDHPVTGSFSVTNMTGSSLVFWDTEP